MFVALEKAFLDEMNDVLTFFFLLPIETNGTLQWYKNTGFQPSYQGQYYNNTNRFCGLSLEIPSPRSNNDARACEGVILTEGLVFPGRDQ